jgi:nucleoside-diphosphate-sugar epimerase
VDIRDGDAVIEAYRHADAIIHNASVVHTLRGMKDAVWGVNVDGTRNLLNAAEKNQITRFIYISSFTPSFPAFCRSAMLCADHPPLSPLHVCSA